MTEAMISKRTTFKPQCNRCLKPVDTATHEPIIQDGKLIGQKITYRCHGESKVYDITQSHFELLNEQRISFMPTEFSEIVEPKLTEADAFREAQRMEFRKQRDAIADFVMKTIQEHTAKGPYFSLSLKSGMDELNRRDADVRELFIDGKSVGRFELPFYPDQTEMKFMPAETDN